MTLYDRGLREQTLLELYTSPAMSASEEAIRLGLAQSLDIVYNTKGDWTRAKMAKVSESLAKELGVAYEPLFKDIKKDIKAQAPTVSLFTVDKPLVNELVRSDLNVQGYTMADLFKSSEQSHIKKLQVTFAAAASRGAGPAEIAKLLKDKNSSITNSQLKSAIITTQNEARARVRHSNYAQLEKEGLIDGYVYVATLDGRTSEYCRNHDGRVYWKTIAEIAGQINVHFRCRSLFSPTSKNKVLRASMNGPVENESYGKWFSRQDSEFQKAVLGNKKYTSFKEGSYKVGGLPDVVGNSLTLAEIESLLFTPEVVTSGSLSPADKFTATDLIGEMAYSIRDYAGLKYVVEGVTEGKFSTSITGGGITLLRSVNLNNLTVNHIAFELPAELQQNGIAKSVIANSFKAYERLGITTVTAKSGLTDGLVVWLKFGFQPESKIGFRRKLERIFFHESDSITTKVDKYLTEWENGDSLALTKMMNDSRIKDTLSKELRSDDTNLNFDLTDKKLLNYLYRYTK